MCVCVWDYVWVVPMHRDVTYGSCEKVGGSFVGR